MIDLFLQVLSVGLRLIPPVGPAVLNAGDTHIQVAQLNREIIDMPNRLTVVLQHAPCADRQVPDYRSQRHTQILPAASPHMLPHDFE